MVLATLAASPARAHEFWIGPTDYSGIPGRPASLGAIAGTGFRGDRIPWSPAHVVRFEARTARRIDLSELPTLGSLEWARFAPSDDGGTMLALESGYTPIQLGAAAFDAYLADQGLTAARLARARSGAAGRVAGRERYRRCAKAWLSGRDAARATTPLGLPLEIVPLEIPGSAPDLRLVLLRDGRPLPGALVKAWRVPRRADGSLPAPDERDSVAVSWKGTTGTGGAISVPVREPGEWLVSTVDMAPCPDRSEADWQSTWASLTFERKGR